MKKLLFSLTFLLFIFSAFAQRVLRGRVNDATGNPLAGVTVTVQGTNTSTQTDPDGSFTINAPRGSTLLVSYVGYQSSEVKVGARDNTVINLQQANQLLNEVVVVAYGTQRKTNITGSINTVKGAEVENKPFTSVDKTLQGAVAGLQSSSSSGAPGSATDIRIRGIGSISAGSNPLWVIDGAIATTGDLSSNTTTSNALSSLNPDDIESISVLKDAAATAVYGSRAANGVILVTTKKGRSGKTKVAFSAESGKNSIAFEPSNKPMTTLQNQSILRESLINAGYAANNQEADAIIIDPVDGLGFDSNYAKTNTNWLDVVTQNAPQQQYNLSVTGGDAKTQFYLSGGYFQQKGLTVATDYKRYNGSLSVTHKISEKLSFSTGINGSYSNQETPASGGAYSNPISSHFFLQPWYSPYNADGSLKYNDAAGQFTNSSGNFNPLVIAAFDHATLKTSTFRGNVSGEYKIIDNLKFTSRYSAELIELNENSYRNPFYGDGFAQGGDGYAVFRRVFDWTWSNFFDYRANLNKAKDLYVDLKAGYEAQRFQSYLLQAGGQSFPKTLDLQYLASAGTPTTASTLPSENTTNSLFSVANLNFKDRYVISGSFRRDASSVFGANHRSGNFYSAGATWNINEEEFLKNLSMISLLKLRSSYGETGNSSGFGNYTSLALVGYGVNYASQPGNALTNVGNQDLTWERNKIFNVGLDFGLWKNRLSGTVEYYNRKTSDLLLFVPLSLTSGVSGQNRNVGAMTNKGIEVTLSGRPVVSQNFTWEVSANFAHNQNKVNKLYLGNPVAYRTRFNITEGHDIQEFYTRLWSGVDPANGNPVWYTDATQGKTTSNFNQVQLSLSGKSASPKYFGGFTNTFTYKNISLQAQFNYNFGNYVYDSWAVYTMSEGVYTGGLNQLSQELTSWKKAGDITNVPKIIYGGNSNSYRPSTRFLYKGDYIRLRNVQVNYSLPKSIFSKTFVSGANVYVRGTNLFLFGQDKNIPFDPEQGINNLSDFNVFIPKTITAGFSVAF